MYSGLENSREVWNTDNPNVNLDQSTLYVLEALSIHVKNMTTKT